MKQEHPHHKLPKSRIIHAIALYYAIQSVNISVAYLQIFSAGDIRFHIVVHGLVRIGLLVIASYGLWRNKLWGFKIGIIAGFLNVALLIFPVFINRENTLLSRIIDFIFLSLFIASIIYIEYFSRKNKPKESQKIMCKHCLTKLPEGTKICSYCGKHLAEDDVEQL